MLGPLLLAISPPKMSLFEERAKDWRFGAVVYQVFLDRFSPPADLGAKSDFIKPPRTLRAWSDLPKRGTYEPVSGHWTHEMEFWGGDLKSLRGKLSYIQGLGIDTLYLNPIFKAFTNHKYDTEDYMLIDPEYGTRSDFDGLITDVHHRKMRVVLDGVFNHMGSSSPEFQDARDDPKSPYRSWFTFSSSFPDGYRAFANVRSMPALRLESKPVQSMLWAGHDSVVKKYLREGIDGWRLDVGYDIGPEFLSQITRSAHEAKPGSWTIGEISGYPAGWSPAVDGVFNFHSLKVAIDMLSGNISGGRAGKMLERLSDDAGLENLMRSWLLIDNHDTDRAANIVPRFQERKLIQLLQFTLPGSPVIYYGSELGMEGIGDPADRAPMRWDLVTPQNEQLAWERKMVKLHQSHRALKYGDFKLLDSDKLLAFARTTDRLRDTVIVAVNPTRESVTETLADRVGHLQSWGELTDLLSGAKVRSVAGLLTVKLDPQTAMVLTPVMNGSKGYSSLDRIP